MEKIIMRNFILKIINISGNNFYLSLLLFTSNFVINILITVTIYEIFNYNQKISLNNHIVVLIILISSRFINSYLLLLIGNKIRKNFCEYIFSFFNTSSWRVKDKPLISTLISRDIPLLLDGMPNISKLSSYPICAVCGLIIIYFVVGIEGVIAMTSIVMFIPISFYVAKKSLYYTNKIYQLSKMRLMDISKWLDCRAIIASWNSSKILIERISSLYKKEIQARNLDSIWRCVDLYLIAFGRAVPITIVILIGLTFSKDLSNQLIIILWFSIPFIALIMEAGRFISDYRLVQQALNEIENSSKKVDNAFLENLVLDSTWEIWDGTLEDNTFTNENNRCFDLFRKFRLDKELIKNNEALDKKYLTRFGTSISAGQKIRILIIRAIHLAMRDKIQLKIDCNINSLDSDACNRLLNVLKEPNFEKRITLSKSCYEAINFQTSRCASDEKIDPLINSSEKLSIPNTSTLNDMKRSLLDDLLIFVRLWSFIFLLPACGLSLIGYLTVAKFSLIYKLNIILLVSFVSISLAIFLGAKSENYIRQWAFQQAKEILLYANLYNIADVFQRVSKDYNAVVERLSWYIHDIIWISSILCVSLIAISISFGAIGILSSIVFVLLSYSTWLYFDKKINIARNDTVKSLNELIVNGENLTCYGNLEVYNPIKKIRANKIASSIDYYYQTNIELISHKTIFSNLIAVFTCFFILSTLVTSKFIIINNDYLIFILTSILTVDSTFTSFFQCLSGFNAQRNSIHRLLEFQKITKGINHAVLTRDKYKYQLSGLINDNLGIEYLPLELEIGSLYSISGESGSGKSQFLMTISRLQGELIPYYINSNENDISTLYINRDSFNIISWINNNCSYHTGWTENSLEQFISEKILKENFKIIILDEALIDFDVLSAKNFINRIQKYIAYVEGLLLFVDHRFSLPRSISISKIKKGAL